MANSPVSTGGLTLIRIVKSMWNKGDWVVVIGGTFDRSGDLKKVQFTIASVVEEGLDDLLVLPKEAYQTR